MEVVLIEALNDHWYKVKDGDAVHWLPSVTTKLGVIDKPGLNRWRADIGQREADLRLYDASQRGKRIHWAWEIALLGGAVIYDPWDKPVYTAEGIADLKKQFGEVAVLRTQDEMFQIVKLQKQFDTLKPKILGVEETVFDLENKDAGTIDGILWIEEGDYEISGVKPLHLESGVYVNDLKTGSYLDENVWLQLAPYAFMYENMHGIKVRGALVTHTSAQTKGKIPGLKTMFRDRQTLLERDYNDYRHAAALWERQHEGDQPEIFQFPSMIHLG